MTAVRAAQDSRAGVVGEYRLLTKLATGGMATVFVGSKQGTAGFKRLVAIKVCHPHLVQDDEFVSMFLDEARISASIRHPNVVDTLDVGHGDLLYLVMEYVEGCSLVGLIKRLQVQEGGRLPIPVTLRLMSGVLAGLHAAHELRDQNGKPVGLVHRDISPHNILIGTDGVARITDFGIAFAEARSVHTQEGHVKGKFSYIAPESLFGKAANRRMDIFSAGIVLWETLAGCSLFKRTIDGETIKAVMDEEAPKPSRYNLDIPPELDAIVLKALSKDPDQRFQTAAEFQAALEEFELADSSELGAIVSQYFGAEIELRNQKIRNEPGTPIDFTPPFALPTTKPPRASEAPRSLPPEAIEHRRMRGIIAAVMLLLVGSALGIMFSRNSPDSSSSKPHPVQKAP